MQIQVPSSWPTTPAAAIALQRTLAPQVILNDRLPNPIRFVVGVDAGFEDQGQTTRAAAVVLSFPDLTLSTAIALVLRCTTRYRLPETTRYADRLASSEIQYRVIVLAVHLPRH